MTETSEMTTAETIDPTTQPPPRRAPSPLLPPRAIAPATRNRRLGLAIFAIGVGIYGF